MDFSHSAPSFTSHANLIRKKQTVARHLIFTEAERIKPACVDANDESIKKEKCVSLELAVFIIPAVFEL